MIGKTLAHYEITALIGKGGMGEVYRARDTKLGRDVALKVLPELAAEDAERRTRFEQEARTIAALNHPNIVTIHSVEEQDGTPFLTMELIEGEPLSRQVVDGGLPLERLLALAVPIADAVGAAHRQGVTHRDLKPDNVMIDAAGRVKVLDFGLAKLLEAAGDDDATRTVALQQTQEGRILGTAAYMSPEQAEGRPVDPRSDVFSLGVVLYEMATGRKPFTGETTISTISAIVKDDPPSVTSVNQKLPRELGRIVARCLVKDPERRYQSAIELRNELEWLGGESASGELAAHGAPVAAPNPRAARLAWIVAGVALAAAVLFAIRPVFAPPPDTSGPTVGSYERITARGEEEREPSLGPNGQLFVYAAGREDVDVFLQRRGGSRPINLTPDHEGFDARPSLSPDGDAVVFESARDGGGIFVMGSTGEAVRRVVGEGHDPRWSPDGRSIVYSTEFWAHPISRTSMSELRIVDVDGGTPRGIAFDGDAVQPDWSPDGRWLVHWGVVADTGQRDLWVVRPDGSDRRRLTADPHVDWNPRFTADGRRIFFGSNRGGSYNLWFMDFSSESGEVLGPPRPLTLPTANLGRFDVSADGTEVLFASRRASSRIVRLDLPASPGAPAPVRPLSPSGSFFIRPAVSPDGRHIAFYNVPTVGDQDVFVVESDGSGLRRLTEDASRDRGPSWHPSGDHLVFYSDRDGSYDVFTVRSDGSDRRRISDLAGTSLNISWFPIYSPDGRWVATFDDRGAALHAVDPETGRLAPPERIAVADEMIFRPYQWHPERNVLLGTIGESLSGDDEGLFAYDVASDRWETLVGAPGTRYAVHSPDGTRLYLKTRDDILVVDVADLPIDRLDDPRVAVLAADWKGTTLVAPSPDGTWLALTQEEFDAEIWSARIE